MDISVFAGPTPGAAQPGNLYADLGSRTLWLGVEAAVDPAQAVLISDIVGLQTEIDGALAEAKAYTDTKILTRAPTVHTHTAAQITDFSAAVTTVVAGIPGFAWVRGMVMQFSGSLAEIGVGGLAGWSLCDGSNGTPDLRERFILGAGSRAVGSKNAATSFDTVAGGGHDHSVNATAISVAQMPYHAHTGNTTDRNVGHSHYVNSNTGGENVGHTHSMPTYSRSDSGSPVAGTWAIGGSSTAYGNYGTSDRSAGHFHNVQGWTSGEDTGHVHGIYGEGSGQGHTHTLVGGGGVHQHNITASNLRETLPFYALAFIMKL